MSDERSQSGNGAGEASTGPRTDPAAPAAHTMVCPACAATYGGDTRFCPLDGSVLKPIAHDADNLVGTVIDERYYLVEKLGEGGMGEVYLGEHVLTHRRCAVKVVSRTLAADPEAFGRFVREATNAGRISHPHVATIYDFGKTDDGLLYLAMEYVEGEPLSRLLERENVLPPARAVEIAQQVAQAVAAAHDLGIVHRDLKPGNILVARDRKGADLVKVVDFGIARATADEQQNLTRTGFVIGTPEYMSPEQLIGDPVDARTDVYALGCILYQMLTGTHTFGDATARLITRRLTERPPRPREVNPAIPKALDEVVVTALGRLPQERYQTMEELRTALLAAPAQPVTTGPRRLASWLGLSANREQRESGTGVRRTAERPVEPATNPPAATTAPTPPAVPPVDPVIVAAAAPATAGVEQTAGETEDATSAPIYDTAFTPPFAEAADSADEAPHSALRPKLAVGAAVVVVALIAVAALARPRGTETEPVPPAQLPEPPLSAPVAAPTPDSALAAVRIDLQQAEAEIAAEEYVGAIVRLRAVESSLATLAATFPDVADVRVLADSARAQLERLDRRCRALEKLAAERSEPLPTCKSADSGP